MTDSSFGQFVVGAMLLLRCLVPLAILLGLSYLLRRWGLVVDTSTMRGAPPPELDNQNGDNQGIAHGSLQ